MPFEGSELEQGRGQVKREKRRKRLATHWFVWLVRHEEQGRVRWGPKDGGLDGDTREQREQEQEQKRGQEQEQIDKREKAVRTYGIRAGAQANRKRDQMSAIDGDSHGMLVLLWGEDGIRQRAWGVIMNGAGDPRHHP